MSTKKKIIILVMIAVILGGGLFTYNKMVSAIIPFGGRILDVDECSCSGGWAITVGPPNPGTFYYQPGASVLYPYYQIWSPGPWVLGIAAPGGVCTSGSKGCFTIPTMGTIIMVGTSL